MAVAYVKVELSLHGLARYKHQALQEILERIKKSIREEFAVDFDSDVEIEVIESAGN